MQHNHLCSATHLIFIRKLRYFRNRPNGGLIYNLLGILFAPKYEPKYGCKRKASFATYVGEISENRVHDHGVALGSPWQSRE